MKFLPPQAVQADDAFNKEDFIEYKINLTLTCDYSCHAVIPETLLTRNIELSGDLPFVWKNI